jgi:hypothetical protein
MPSKTQQGYLVLADISGFVAYLAGVELEHAQEILSELLELLVARLVPPLTLASLEGDAVFAFTPQSAVARGETLLEVIEGAYAAFKDRLLAIRRRTTCTCRACQAVPALDLKFLVHHGEFAARRGANGHELVGLDVELVRRRLLKDQVNEADGRRGYALFTEQSLERLRLWPEGMQARSATYEHVGEVRTQALNLQARYQAMVEARRVRLTPEEADCAVARELPAPPPVVWAWLNDPHRRTQWMRGRTWSAALRPGGRTGAGARNHCAHGVGDLVETILDWRPFDYFTVEMITRPGALRAIQTYRLEPLGENGRTRLHSAVRLASLPAWLGGLLCRLMLAPLLRFDYHTLERLIAAEAAREP